MWNEEQTACLEEYVRKSGEWPPYNSYTLDTSGAVGPWAALFPSSATIDNSCISEKGWLDNDRNSKIQREDLRYQEEIKNIREDYASRGMYNSGVRERAEGLASIIHQQNIDDIENLYQRDLQRLRAAGCKL